MNTKEKSWKLNSTEHRKQFASGGPNSQFASSREDYSALAVCQWELHLIIYSIAQFLVGQSWKEK
jgi:hypothetical protein